MTSLRGRTDMADNLGFAIPVNYVKDFLRNREAFSFDKENPNTGYRYLDPPRRLRAGRPPGATVEHSSQDNRSARRPNLRAPGCARGRSSRPIPPPTP